MILNVFCLFWLQIWAAVRHSCSQLEGRTKIYGSVKSWTPDLKRAPKDASIRSDSSMGRSEHLSKCSYDKYGWIERWLQFLSQGLAHQPDGSDALDSFFPVPNIHFINAEHVKSCPNPKTKKFFFLPSEPSLADLLARNSFLAWKGAPNHREVDLDVLESCLLRPWTSWAGWLWWLGPALLLGLRTGSLPETLAKR